MQKISVLSMLVDRQITKANVYHFVIHGKWASTTIKKSLATLLGGAGMGELLLCDWIDQGEGGVLKMGIIFKAGWQALDRYISYLT